MVTVGAVLCRRLRPNQRELSRKIVHIGTGAVVPLAWFFQIPFVVALPVAAVITVLTAMNHQWRFIPAVEDVDRNSYGTIAYGLAITILLLLLAWLQSTIRRSCRAALLNSAAASSTASKW